MDRCRFSTTPSFDISVSRRDRASSQTILSKASQALSEGSPGESVQSPNDPGERRGSVIDRIEDIVESMVDSLSENQPLTLPLRSRRSGNEYTVSFPATTANGVKKFTALLQILFLCHEALVSDTIITKRNIYYQNPELFGSQDYVNRLVDDVAYTFGVGRNELNIVAASKGLVAGQPFGTEHGDEVVMIPPADAVVDLDLRPIEWILVIEKEATFRSLVSLRYHEISVAGRGILMTAKGYPDLSSRQFIHAVHSTWPQIPIYALMDFDPDGVSILRTYKRGSQGMRHEERVTVPGLLWLGVKNSDLLELQMRLLPTTRSEPSNGDGESQSTLASSQSSRAGSSRTLARSLPGSARRHEAGWKILSLSGRDRTKAVRLLSTLSDQHHQDADEMELTSELQLMLMLNMKFEIQAVDRAENMAHWLDERLSRISGWV
ncbi:DNA topoisomerase IV- alpha subunit [Apiospora rasikravindrae]|uniref:DNA topoisomerase (ATP-hydrolyzing) n=1 Tax=Apiospora rasikravindrae TaxID=990691 RepID=A0ABR1RSA4_9PEZI